MKIYYLAHPVTGDDEYTYEENLEHAIEIARILYAADIYVDLPWYAIIHILDNNDPKHLEVGLQIVTNIAAERDGVIMVGHKISRGMSRERDTALDNARPVYNCTHVRDKDLVTVLRSFIKD